MVEVSLFDFTTGVIGIFATWCMYSTLYGKSNPLRSWAQASYVGLAMGLSLVIATWYVYNNAYIPMTHGDYIMIFGIILGLVMVLRLHPKLNIYSRLPIAIAIGAQLALSLRTTIFASFIQQITSSIQPFYTGDFKTTLYNTTIGLSVLFMLTFFIYTYEQKGILKWSARLGEYFLYVSFGAIFAQTFMGRLGLFVGYIQQITDPSWKVPYTLGFAVLVFAAIIILDKKGISEKYAD